MPRKSQRPNVPVYDGRYTKSELMREAEGVVETLQDFIDDCALNDIDVMVNHQRDSTPNGPKRGVQVVTLCLTAFIGPHGLGVRKGPHHD